MKNDMDDKIWIMIVGILGTFTTLYAALSNNNRLKKADTTTKEVDFSKVTLDWAKTLIARVDYLEMKVKKIEEDSALKDELIKDLTDRLKEYNG